MSTVNHDAKTPNSQTHPASSGPTPIDPLMKASFPVQAAAVDCMMPVTNQDESQHHGGASLMGREDGEDWGFVSTAQRLFRTGYPITLSALAQFSINAVVISVVGKCLGVVPLGGASLALGLVNATGFAFGAGLCGALETVLSHTYGRFRHSPAATDEDADGQHEMRPLCNEEGMTMYGIYTQRMAVILWAMALPLGLVVGFADLYLAGIGEDADVVAYAGIWCRVATFGIPAVLTYQLVLRYYSCQHVTGPVSVAMIAAALLNPFLQLLCVKMWGFWGSPVAWLLLMCGTVLGLLLYVPYSGLHANTWGGWDSRCLHHLPSLMRITFPSVGVMLSEWVAFEVNGLVAGFAPPDDLAAFAITVQLFGLLWGTTSGLLIMASVFVGNAIGAGQPLLARRIAFYSICCVFAMSLVNLTVCLLLRDHIPYLFTDDDDVVHIYHSLIDIALPYHLFDTFQSTVMAILRGCGLQRLGAIIITIVFCLVGVPLSFLLFFHFDLGVRALWIGPCIGVSVVGFPLYIYILIRHIDWPNLTPHNDIDPTIQQSSEDTPIRAS